MCPLQWGQVIVALLLFMVIPLVMVSFKMGLGCEYVDSLTVFISFLHARLRNTVIDELIDLTFEVADRSAAVSEFDRFWK
jgi:hypothetical protein